MLFFRSNSENAKHKGRRCRSFKPFIHFLFQHNGRNRSPELALFDLIERIFCLQGHCTCQQTSVTQGSGANFRPAVHPYHGATDQILCSQLRIKRCDLCNVSAMQQLIADLFVENRFITLECIISKMEIEHNTIPVKLVQTNAQSLPAVVDARRCNKTAEAESIHQIGVGGTIQAKTTTHGQIHLCGI